MKHQTLSEESIDALLADFFKAQMSKPWPVAPVVEYAQSQTFTTTLANQNTLAVVKTDSNARARYTLAASIALLFGSCWMLSNGFESGHRSAPNMVPTVGTVDLNSVGASDPLVGKELRKTHGENDPAGGFDPNAIDPFK